MSGEPEIPGWANWFAVDADGSPWVYENEPRRQVSNWDATSGRSERFEAFRGLSRQPWRESAVRIGDGGRTIVHPLRHHSLIPRPGAVHSERWDDVKPLPAPPPLLGVKDLVVLSLLSLLALAGLSGPWS